MSLLPSLTPKEVLSVLLKAGFRIIHQKGSHVRLKHPEIGRSTTIAMHPKDFSRRMVRIILSQAGISVKEFLRLLRK